MIALEASIVNIGHRPLDLQLPRAQSLVSCMSWLWELLFVIYCIIFFGYVYWDDNIIEGGESGSVSDDAEY